MTSVVGTRFRCVGLLPRFAALIAATGVADPVAAQFFARCESGSRSELEYSIRAHEEHSYRLNRKFLDEYYFQGELPDTFIAATLADIQDYLRAEASRNAAVLFHAYSDTAICTWLISADDVVADVVAVAPDAIEDLGADLRSAIQVTSNERARSPRRRGVAVIETGQPGSLNEDEALASLRRQLLPDRIRSALLVAGHDTLLVAAVSNVATLPLAALPVDDSRDLVDIASILIIPGFSSLQQDAIKRRFAAGPALVVGNPTPADEEWDFPPLPGAREESLAVAELVESDPLIDDDATLSQVLTRIAAQPDLSLIYLATHGVASRTDPRDASFLMLAGGRWAAADIQNLDLKSHPLVVLSACQTGLGKDFDVGTIGMARAWERAGASNIVMSLWNVGDLATRDLMLEFVARIGSKAADQALREAMLEMRSRDYNISQWASFTVFGLPETLLQAGTGRKPCCTN